MKCCIKIYSHRRECRNKCNNASKEISCLSHAYMASCQSTKWEFPKFLSVLVISLETKSISPSESATQLKHIFLIVNEPSKTANKCTCVYFIKQIAYIFCLIYRRESGPNIKVKIGIFFVRFRSTNWQTPFCTLLFCLFDLHVCFVLTYDSKQFPIDPRSISNVFGDGWEKISMYILPFFIYSFHAHG